MGNFCIIACEVSLNCGGEFGAESLLLPDTLHLLPQFDLALVKLCIRPMAFGGYYRHKVKVGACLDALAKLKLEFQS